MPRHVTLTLTSNPLCDDNATRVVDNWDVNNKKRKLWNRTPLFIADELIKRIPDSATSATIITDYVVDEEQSLMRILPTLREQWIKRDDKRVLTVEAEGGEFITTISACKQCNGEQHVGTFGSAAAGLGTHKVLRPCPKCNPNP